jgi:hypothetical protein
MGIRESINRHPKTAVGVGSALVVLTIAVLLFQLHDSSDASGIPSADERAFFTVDDGKTWFAGDIHTLPPFDHDGKQAVRAYVYECDGQRFAGFLERYTEAGKKAKQQVTDATKTGRPDGRLVAVSQGSGREIKRPGDKNWTVGTDQQAVESITDVRCPRDSTRAAQLVQP